VPHPLIVASNRGPVTYHRDGDTWSTSRGGGGLVTALSGLEIDQKPAMWICAALTDDDREAVAAGMSEPSVRMLLIDPERLSAAYDDVANSTLWFAHHMLWDLKKEPAFTFAFRRQWMEYHAYNAAFAEAIDAEAENGAIILIQDYHLSLVPHLLRLRRPDLKTSHFSHTPWAPPEYLSVLPRESAEELLTGILGADHAGFHADRWAQDFVDCCVEILGAQAWREEGGWVVRHHHRTTRIDVHPLGIDGESFSDQFHQPEVSENLERLRERYADCSVIVRVDRTEPSKNILRGLQGFRQLLVERPEWQERVVHFALIYLSRQDIPEYREYTEEIAALAEEINREFETPTWKPVDLHLEENMALTLAAYAMADVLLVNPIRDGMNLVAKEGAFISNLTDHGVVLVLSRNAGSADTMSDSALIINPFDIEETAQVLHTALLMDRDERKRRTYFLAQTAIALPPSAWLSSQITAVTSDIIRVEERASEHL
jgi:trehalose 6-phosphate synthase